MLPRELLVVSKRKGTIKPRYLSDTRVAAEVIALFTRYQGRKHKELTAKLDEIAGTKFKLIRGLGTLLERRCRFRPSSPLEGAAVRSFVFARGCVTTDIERERVVGEAARFFGVTPPVVEDALFSDLEEEQVLAECTPPSAEALLQWYNLSLTQTLVFDAVTLCFKVTDQYQPIFRQIKYLGLMYEINETIRVTGPASLFKKTRKYGTALAKLLPVIMTAQTWSLQASIETQVGGEPRILEFSLDSTSDVAFPHRVESSVHFDSAVEAQFYREFTSLGLEWELQREPAVVKAGTAVVIPDFGFYRHGLVHYLEIVGFWTPEYLQKKLMKLRKAKVPITVVVNKNLECTKEEFGGEVIFYTTKIPLLPIVQVLRKLEDDQVTHELARLGDLHLSEDVVSITKTAAAVGVSPETLAHAVIPGYQVIGDQLVSHRYLDTVAGELYPDQAYQEVASLLESYRLPVQAVEYMGYKIVWNGLHPTKVVKRTGGSVSKE